MHQNKLIIILLICIVTISAATENSQAFNLNIVGLFKNKVVVLDEFSENKVLSVGDTTESGLKLISASSHIAVFEDPEGNIIKTGISETISTKFNETENTSEFIMLNNDQYSTMISINNKKNNIPAIIDTGATSVSLNSQLANELGINYKKSNKVNISTANAQNIYGYSIILDSVQLGDIKIEHVEAVVIEGEQPDQVLIGMSFLKYLELNYSGNKLELKLNNPKKS